MKQRTKLAILITLVYLSLSIVAAAQQQEGEPRWSAKIIKVSRPDLVKIRKPNEVERNDAPGENRQWLVLDVELTAEPRSVMNTEEIGLVDEELRSFPAIGRDWGRDIFVLFAEIPAGLGVARNPMHRKEVILLSELPYTSKTKLIAQSGLPSEMSLLFKIEPETKLRHFQMGNNLKVLMPPQ
jgi:hypothetical protein